MTREWVNKEQIFIRCSKLHNILHCGIVFMSIEYDGMTKSLFYEQYFFLGNQNQKSQPTNWEQLKVCFSVAETEPIQKNMPSVGINCNLGKVTHAYRSVIKETDSSFQWIIWWFGFFEDDEIVSQIWSENKVCKSPLISLDQIVVMDKGLHDCLRRKE